jgi:hypothetical protein
VRVRTSGAAFAEQLTKTNVARAKKIPMRLDAFRGGMVQPAC